MISPEELKYATDFIISTLKDLRMSKYTIKVYSLHYQELHDYDKYGHSLSRNHPKGTSDSG